MSTGRSTTSPLVGVSVVVTIALLAAWLGWLGYQAATRPDPRPLTFAEQVKAIPGVSEVEVDCNPVPGSGRIRTVTSEVVFDQAILDTPSASATRLANVSHGWSGSDWSIRGLDSTADVHYLAPVDKAPIAWWLEGVALLREQHPGSTLDCTIRSGSLACKVRGGNAPAAREALQSIDTEAVDRWVENSHPSGDQPRGFILR